MSAPQEQPDGHTKGPLEARPDYSRGEDLMWRVVIEDRPNICTAQLCSPEDAMLYAAAPDMVGTGAFLLERLADFENRISTDEDAREFHGHVAPAIANFRAAIAKALGQ